MSLKDELLAMPHDQAIEQMIGIMTEAKAGVLDSIEQVRNLVEALEKLQDKYEKLELYAKAQAKDLNNEAALESFLIFLELKVD